MIQTINKILRSYIETVGKKQFIFMLFFGIFVSLIVVIEPLIFVQIIKQIENFYLTGKFDFDTTTTLIIYWGLFILFSIVIQYIYRYYFLGKTTLQNYVDECNKYTKKIISMNYSIFLSKKQGSLYKILDRGTDNHIEFIYFFFSDFIKSISGILFIIIILFYIDIKMTLVVLIMLPIMIGLGVFFMKKIAPKQMKITNKWDAVFGSLGNLLSGFMLTKTLTLEGKYIRNIKNRLSSIHKEQLQVSKMWSIANIYTSTIVMISRILVLGFGVYYVINGSLSFTNLFLFFSYIGWIYFPLGFIFGRLEQLNKQLASIKKMHDEFDDLELEDIKSGDTIKHLKGNIEYNDVNFGYIKSNKIFNKLSFKINHGEKIAFVGNTGSGKSTLVNLLLRFWELDSGNITIDGNNINNISKTSLRNHIGVVTQDTSLFNDTVLNNLLFANSKATKEDIKIALKKSEANFVYDFENGLNTIIGERGLKLSGGEKQRLSIARLFLKNPKILVLDEATSALDNKTEKLIQKALDNLMKGRTSIVIAHRLSTIQNSDKIFMLEKGKIVDTGNYEELMAKKGKFYSLANPEHLILN